MSLSEKGSTENTGSAITPVQEVIHNIAMLQPNFLLTQPPKNYMRRRSLVEELIFRAAASEFQKKSPSASINLLSEFVDAFDSFDAVVGIKSIKNFIRAIFSKDQALSLLVRQLDGVLLIDEFDIDNLLLRLRVESEWNWLLSFIRQREMILCRCHPEEEKQRMLNDLYEKFLYHTVNNSQALCLVQTPPSNNSNPPLALQTLTLPALTYDTPSSSSSSCRAMLPTSYSPSTTTNNKSSLSHSAETYLRWSVYDFGAEDDANERKEKHSNDDSINRQRFPSSSSQGVNEDLSSLEKESNKISEPSMSTSNDTESLNEKKSRKNDSPSTHQSEENSRSSVSWRCLVGSDMAVFGTPQHPRVSLNLQPHQECISVLRGIDLWLENEINRVPEIGMCFHMDGVVTKDYNIRRTEELPNEMGFQPEDVKEAVRHFLEFMRDRCTKPGHSYWLIKEKDTNMLKMFDLTELYSKVCNTTESKNETNNSTPGQTRSSESSCSAIFLQPVCLLCIRRAESLLEKYRTRFQSASGSTLAKSNLHSHTTPSIHLIGGEKYLRKAATALHTCLRLLDVMQEEEPMRKEISSRALNLLILVYQLGPNIVVKRLQDDFWQEFHQQKLGLEKTPDITLYSVVVPIQDMVPHSTVARIQEARLSRQEISLSDSQSSHTLQSIAEQRHSFACIVPQAKSNVDRDSTPTFNVTNSEKTPQMQALAPNSLSTLIRMLRYTPVDERKKVYCLIASIFQAQVQQDIQKLSSSSSETTTADKQISLSNCLKEEYLVVKSLLIYTFLAVNCEKCSQHDHLANLIRLCHALDRLVHLPDESSESCHPDTQSVEEVKLTELDYMLLFYCTLSSSPICETFTHEIAWGVLSRLSSLIQTFLVEGQIETFQEALHILSFEIVELAIAAMQPHHSNTAPSKKTPIGHSTTGLFSNLFSRCEVNHHHAWGIVFSVLMNVAPHIQLAMTKGDAGTSSDTKIHGASSLLSRYFEVCRQVGLPDRQVYPQYAIYVSLNELGLLYLRGLTETRVNDYITMVRQRLAVCKETFSLVEMILGVPSNSEDTSLSPVIVRHALSAALDMCDRMKGYQLKEKTTRECFIMSIQTVEIVLPYLKHMVDPQNSPWELVQELSVLSLKMTELPSALSISEEAKFYQHLCQSFLKISDEAKKKSWSPIYCIVFMHSFVVQSSQPALSVNGILDVLKQLSTIHSFLPHFEAALQNLHLATSNVSPLLERFRKELFKVCVELEAKKVSSTGSSRNSRSKKSASSTEHKNLNSVLYKITGAFQPDVDASSTNMKNIFSFCTLLHSLL